MIDAVGSHSAGHPQGRPGSGAPQESRPHPQPQGLSGHAALVAPHTPAGEGGAPVGAVTGGAVAVTLTALARARGAQKGGILALTGVVELEHRRLGAGGPDTSQSSSGSRPELPGVAEADASFRPCQRRQQSLNKQTRIDMKYSVTNGGKIFQSFRFQALTVYTWEHFYDYEGR